MIRFLRRSFLLILVIAFAVVYVLAFIAPYVNPYLFFIPAILGTAFFYLFLAGLALAIVLKLFNSRLIWLMCILLIPGFFRIGYYYQSFNFSAKAETKSSIKIISLNAKIFSDLSNNVGKQYKFINKVNELQPDVICFQEYYFNTSASNLKIAQLSKLLNLPYYRRNTVSNSDSRGQVVLSKYPVETIKNKSYRANGYQIVEIKHPKMPVNLINMHLASFRINPSTIDPNTKGQYSNILKRLKYGFQNRSFQLKDILKDITTFKDPVIVVGDLNDTPNSYAYKQFYKHYKDAFREAGSGFGYTYNGKIPGLRIDYFFTSDPFTAVDYQVLKDQDNISDHYPIYAEFELP